MDTGKGYMEEFEEDKLEGMKEKHPEHKGIFREGEILEIKGSKFMVKQVTRYQMTLKLWG